MSYSKRRNMLLQTTVAWALLAGVAPALAQTAAAQGADDQTSEEEIVVTGSRLPATEFTSPSAIQVISPEAARASGVNDTAQLLQGSTLAAGSAQLDATISSAFVTSGGPGAQTLSLRGLGANRTLILLNGRRAGPAGVRGQVSAFDLNVVPQSALERVEIQKEGASSVYGSDAIAGTVNLITTQELDGGSINFFGDLATEGAAGETLALDASFGRTFDRARFSVSADYYRQTEMKFGDRPYTACGADYIFTPGGARFDRTNPITGAPNCFGTAASVFLYEYIEGDGSPWDSGAGAAGYLDSNNGNGTGGRVRFQYDPSGQISGAVPSTIIPTGDPFWPNAPAGWIVDGFDRQTQGAFIADGPLQRNATLIPSIERYTVFAQGGVDLGANTEAYAELLLNRRKTATEGVRQFWTYFYTYDYTGNPLDAGWTGTAYLSPTAITDHNSASQSVDYIRFVGGLRGDAPNPTGLGQLRWDIFYQGSRSDGDYTQDVILQDAVDMTDFFHSTCSSLGNPVTSVSQRQCVDVNWLSWDFLQGNPTAAERAFLFDTETGNTVYEQQFVEGFVSGDVLTLPAGNVGAVLGFHVRRDSIDDVPGAVTLANNSWGLSGAGVTRGEKDTREVFGELGIPLLHGAAFAEDLRVTLSGRLTDDEFAGTASTYKAGVNWQITPSWRIRATTGTSFRAPALFESFLANETGFFGQRTVDPCIQWAANLAAGNISQRTADNCAADGIASNFSGGTTGATVTSSGSLDLLPEESTSSVIGIVWTPQFIDLSVAVDYFEITVENQVTRLGANIPAACYNSVNFPADPTCNLFTRNGPNNGIDTITDNFINVSEQNNRGIDLTTRYRHDLGWGELTWATQATWQLENNIAVFPGFTILLNGTEGNPTIVANSLFELDIGDWSWFWRTDYIGRSSDAPFQSDGVNVSIDGLPGGVTAPAIVKIRSEPTIYHTATMQRDFDNWSISVGIANLFDEHPPALSTIPLSVSYTTAGTSNLQSNYDYVGRRFFLSLSREF
jgi:iron complex outermembrane recepter protein